MRGRDERSDARPWAVQKLGKLTPFPLLGLSFAASTVSVRLCRLSLTNVPLRKPNLKLTPSRHSLARASPVIGAVGGAAWYMTRLARGTEGASALSLLPFPPHHRVGRADDPPFPTSPTRPSFQSPIQTDTNASLHFNSPPTLTQTFSACSRLGQEEQPPPVAARQGEPAGQALCRQPQVRRRALEEGPTLNLLSYLSEKSFRLSVRGGWS